MLPNRQFLPGSIRPRAGVEGQASSPAQDCLPSQLAESRYLRPQQSVLKSFGTKVPASTHGVIQVRCEAASEQR
jgi:hypothetical protein